MKKQSETRDRLLSAIENLLSKKKLDSISVSEIAEIAIISRKTFYRHYQDKYDLVEDYFEQIFDNTFGLFGDGTDFEESLMKYLDICESKSVILKNAYSSTDIHGLRNIDIQQTEKSYYRFLQSENVDINSYEIKFAVEIAVRGGMEMLIQWLINDMPISKTEFCRLIRKTLPPVLSGFMVKKN